ncbi:GGDEF domain-containing protein [Bordetella sp. N]|uniref:GGDEF domain-containing protein n=1 Tax=Bordetella sp. N TaxID=1746199 RepID=UPI000710318C|nr:GGDEF domain-containing protein [Bordetella sp. N]ALM83131.1 hypothetical protein ASB57_09335 [Bordetella sp. N]
MIGPTIMMVIAMLACLIMLGPSGALARAGIPGLRSCFLAAALTVLAVLILAARPVLPPILGIMVGNPLLGAAMALYVGAVLQFFGRPVPVRGLVLIVVMETVGLGFFLYVWPVFAVRVVIMSIMLCTLAATIAATVLRYRPLHRPAYPYVFMLAVAVLSAVAHALRSLVYLFNLEQVDTLAQASIFQTVLVSLILLTLPGLTLGMIIMAHDRLLSTREVEAGMDGSTGALSRKAWWLMAEKTALRAARNDQRFSVLVLQIDHYQHINDTCGRLLGDAVLQHFVMLAGAVLREEDLLGRLEGETFAVLYPDIRIDAAQFASGKLLQTVRDTACTYGSWSMGYTFSGGVVEWDGHEDAQALLGRAAQALAAAEEEGRDCIVVR